MKLMSYGVIGACFVSLMFAGAGRARAEIAGFNPTDFMVNNTTGGATIAGGTLTLTNNLVGEAHTVFDKTAQDVRLMTASFTYQASGDRTGEGFAFVVQNDTRGAGAFGFGGAGLDYFGIFPSVALEVNINSANTTGIAFGQATTALNGTIGPYITPGSINLAGGDHIGFLVIYDGTSLRATLTDRDNASIPSFTTSTVVNVPSLLGSNTGFVGFAGATGLTTAKSIQTLSQFTFSSTAVPEPSSIIMAMSSCVTGFGVWHFARRKAAAA